MLAGAKSLLAFLLFYSSYVALSTVRMDWWQGHQTLSWLEEAHTHCSVARLQDAQEMGTVAEYIERDLGAVVAELQDICETCLVCITPRSTDLTFLSLADFVKADCDTA